MDRATRWPMSTAVVALVLLAIRRRRITVGSWGGISYVRAGAWGNGFARHGAP